MSDDDDGEFSVEESLTELSELVGTAGLEVAGSTYQKVGLCIVHVDGCVSALVCRCVCVEIHTLSPHPYPPQSIQRQVFDFNSRTCIGSGKVSQIKNAMAALGCKTVIVDEELTPSQQVGGGRLLYPCAHHTQHKFTHQFPPH